MEKLRDRGPSQPKALTIDISASDRQKLPRPLQALLAEWAESDAYEREKWGENREKSEVIAYKKIEPPPDKAEDWEFIVVITKTPVDAGRMPRLYPAVKIKPSEVFYEYAIREIGCHKDTPATIYKLDYYTYPDATKFLDEQNFRDIFNAITREGEIRHVDPFLLKEEITNKEHAKERVRKLVARLVAARELPEHSIDQLDYWQTFKKIKSPDQFPSTQEVVELIKFFGDEACNPLMFDTKPFDSVRDISGRLNSSVKSDFGWSFVSRDFSMMREHGIHHIFTEELIEGIAELIKKLGIKGNIVEVAAGNGKLSRGLNHQGIPIKVTDWASENPADVEQLDAEQTLAVYQPELVVGSWLLPHSGIGSAISKCPTVRYYIEISSSRVGAEGERLICDITGQFSMDFNKHSHLDQLEPFSIPIDILYSTEEEKKFRSDPVGYLKNKATIFLHEKNG